ncbi:unnamed protein product [Leptidea sinapis]|uniref:DNA helicase MCM9 n=1 Tax=Leptidea sinapis TaxID=189913 RepID=A0A5E4QRQ5_9NEOP|nr:unnamed protein product [Leptidea sinapis]
MNNRFSMIIEYLTAFHLQDCLNILSQKDTLAYYSIKIDFLKLFESYPDVGDSVLCSPVNTLSTCNNDIIKVQQTLIEKDEHKNVISKLDHYSIKRNVNARFYGLPVCPELHRTIFPKNVDLGCFLKVSGTVVRVTQSRMLEYQRKYVCMKCKYENMVEAEFENRYILKAPRKCQKTDSRCKCATFTQVNLVSREYCKDYQEIKIQEQINKLNIGTIPGSIGTVRRRWRPSTQNKCSDVELVLHANYIEVSNSQRAEVIASAPDVKDCFNEFWEKYAQCPLKGRDQLLGSVCPQHKVCDDGHSTHVRGQCHLLLVGDPGTGKSQLLRAGAELTPRSVFTSGAGSTKAGLTCAALRENGEWQLEAGALVMSDGGVCCIDEISHLRDHDRTAIHEAMEQQTISIAKRYYMMQRKSENRDPSRTTVRMLDSLVRLSQAHCRLMYRTTILPVDAIMAISLVDLSMQDCTLTDTVDALHSTFQKYPDYDFLCLAKKLLTQLKLHDIWKEELLYYAKQFKIDHVTLENEINIGSSKLFAKYDELEDNNIPLSASIVTSTYFKKPDINVDNRVENTNKENVVNNRLVETLKKHATLNKEERKPPTTQKKSVSKRKRKEVVISTNNLKFNSCKKNKKAKINTSIESESDIEDYDVNKILKGVPSVNDAFSELGIDFKISKESTPDPQNNENMTVEVTVKKSINESTTISNRQKSTSVNNTLNRLKQFEFKGKSDYDNLISDAKIKQEKSIQLTHKDLESKKEGKSGNVIQKKQYVSSSQISMFDSSDCDIDLDI